MAEISNDWATPRIKEFIFWHEGMTPDDYEIEQDYFFAHMNNPQKRAEYQPIWKQLEFDKSKRIVIDETWASPYMKGFEFWYSGITLEEYKKKYKKYFEELTVIELEVI